MPLIVRTGRNSAVSTPLWVLLLAAPFLLLVWLVRGFWVLTVLSARLLVWLVRSVGRDLRSLRDTRGGDR